MTSPSSDQNAAGIAEITLGKSERQQVSAIAADLCAKDPTLEEGWSRDPLVVHGRVAGPSLIFDNRGDIAHALAGKIPSTYRDYRALLLAGEKDTVLIHGPRDATFEDYCRMTLGLGTTDVLAPASHVQSGARFLTQECLQDSALIEQLTERAHRHGGINLVPFVGTEDVWALAHQISRQSKEPVGVHAPTPRLVALINDPCWFIDRVADVLDRRTAPALRHVRTADELARDVSAAALREKHIAVHFSDPFGRTENIVLDSGQLAGNSERMLAQRIQALAEELGQDNSTKMSFALWDGAVLSAPTVQVSVPIPEDRSPVVEDIYERRLGDEVIWYERCELPESWRYHIAAEALYLAGLMQNLGYSGRLSFNAVLAGDAFGTATIYWVGCDGYWNDLSVFDIVSKRFLSPSGKHAAMCIYHGQTEFAPRSFAEITRLLGNHLFRPGFNDEGVVVLSPQPMSQGTGFHFFSIGHSRQHARTEALYAMALLKDAPPYTNGSGV